MNVEQQTATVDFEQFRARVLLFETHTPDAFGRFPTHLYIQGAGGNLETWLPLEAYEPLKAICDGCPGSFVAAQNWLLGHGFEWWAHQIAGHIKEGTGCDPTPVEFA